MRKGDIVRVSGNSNRAYVMKGTNKADGMVLIYDYDKHCDYYISISKIERV